MVSESTLRLVIASVGETRFDGPATSVTLPGEAGELTVLPHHELFVSTLKKGTITVRDVSNEPKTFDIKSGVLEVSGNRAAVLL